MRNLLACLVPAAIAASLFLGTSSARAGEVALGAGVGVALPLQNTFKAGVDVDGLLGYRLHVGPFFLQPEAVGGYRNLGDASLGRFGAGAHFGFGHLVQPQVYAHVGAAFGDVSGFNFDGGGALDLKVSVVYVGVHAGFDILSNSAVGPASGNSIQWLDLGLHAGLLL